MCWHISKKSHVTLSLCVKNLNIKVFLQNYFNKFFNCGWRTEAHWNLNEGLDEQLHTLLKDQSVKKFLQFGWEIQIKFNEYVHFFLKAEWRLSFWKPKAEWCLYNFKKPTWGKVGQGMENTLFLKDFRTNMKRSTVYYICCNQTLEPVLILPLC